MFVVVIGARERDCSADKENVPKLLDQLREKYPRLVVVSTGCDKGVGLLVKSYCLKPENKNRIQFVEVSMRTYGELVRTQTAQLYLARNATLVELGEEFHIFDVAEKRSSVKDLIQRLQKTRLPFHLWDDVCPQP